MRSTSPGSSSAREPARGVPASAPYEALLVPDSAIGTEQTRKYLTIVDAQDVARQRYVTLGQLTREGLRVIKEGIGVDDRIVVKGLMHARPGTKVRPQEDGAKPVARSETGAAPQPK